MLKQIQSGCQRGADIAGIDAAICENFPYSGWVPKGRRTESGPLESKYIVSEMLTAGYPPRTKKNIISSCGTVIFTHGTLTGGSLLTRKYAREAGKPWLHINFEKMDVKEVVEVICFWMKKYNITILNVAGRSASKDELIYNRVFRVVRQVILRSN